MRAGTAFFINWITNVNFIYVILDSLRSSLITSEVNYNLQFLIFLINMLGILLSIIYLHFQTKKIPFLV